MSLFSADSREKSSYYLSILLIISILSHFPFVLKGFGEIDATKIAVSVIDILSHGPDAAFANFYFTDVIPLYVLYLSWFMKLLNYDYSYLPAVMNYTNAVFGTLTLIPAFFLIKQLFRNPAIAFCSVLALIFAPSFYQSTIMGFPHLIAFFFLLVSLCFFLSGLDHNRHTAVYFLMFLSCTFLTVAFLFKSDIVLTSGAYIGLLIMRNVKDKGKITGALLIVLISGILFLLFRDIIIGSSGSGTTMTKAGMSKWYDYSLIIPSNLSYLLRQTKPIAYGAGIITFCLGIILFTFYLFRKRLDIIVFIVSWTALPTLFWLVMIGNNARHNMFATLPLLVMICIFFKERAPRYLIILTVILIAANFFATSPSSSVLTPSGNIFKSNSMLKDRVAMFQANAQNIVSLKEDKMVILGYFHNPHVVFEIMSSAPDYNAVKIGREDYKILAWNKEYLFIYFIATEPGDIKKGTDYILNKYNLQNHVFVSATYDLSPLDSLGLKTVTFDIIKRSTL